MKPIILSFITCLVSLCLPAQQKPNIIFILADDMGYGDLGCYGQQKIKTPNIDGLAAAGMRFTDFYAGSTVCSPSRAALMTGKHTGHGYIRGNGEINMRAEDLILPEMLHKAGYTTGMAGKWGLGAQNTSGAPEKKGWDFFSGVIDNKEGHFQHPDSAWQIINGVSMLVKLPNKMYINEWFKDEALSFIENNRQRPFFLFLSFTLPHAELNVPPTYIAPYLNEDGSSKFAPEKAQPDGLHYGPQPYPKAAYAGMVSQVDDHVGQVSALLQKLGLDKNTIVIFSSDNGTHVEGGRTKEDTEFFKSSGPLRGVKRDMYDGGIRVPFIVRWKDKIKPGTTQHHIGAFWDMMPTFAQLAGLQQPASDGVSFVPALLGQPQPMHNQLYWEFYEKGFKQAARKGNWKAVRYYDGTNPLPLELYDLSKDISEKNNIAASFPGIVKEMEAIMEKEHVVSVSPLFQIK